MQNQSTTGETKQFRAVIFWRCFAQVTYWPSREDDCGETVLGLSKVFRLINVFTPWLAFQQTGYRLRAVNTLQDKRINTKTQKQPLYLPKVTSTCQGSWDYCERKVVSYLWTQRGEASPQPWRGHSRSVVSSSVIPTYWSKSRKGPKDS